MTPPTDPMSEARALAEVIEYGDPEERDAGIVAAVRAFRAICAPESVEALARVIGEALCEDVATYGAAEAVLAHLARIAMEGAER